MVGLLGVKTTLRTLLVPNLKVGLGKMGWYFKDNIWFLKVATMPLPTK